MSIAALAFGPQIPLDLEPVVAPKYPPGSSIDEKFEAFHAANPWVATALEKLVCAHLETGARRGGIRMFWEVMRWRYDSATRGDSFKANNDFPSRYSRLLIRLHPEWDGVFETRELRTP